MDQGLDKKTLPSTSYRETFRRHRKLLCMPIILGALAAAFFLFGMGKTYKSTANVWVDTSPPAPSSLGDSAAAQPPAVAEQAILSELLATRAFALSVAHSMGSADASQANAARLLANGHVVGTVAGGQVLQISSSASSSAMAENVVGAVVAQLRNYTNRLAAQHNQATVADAREQVKAAETAVATARSNVTAYQAQHPRATPTDPNYASLVAAENSATTQLGQANTGLSQMTGNADGWSITVIDRPSEASTTPLGKKKMAEVILGGALGGLLVSFLAVVALTPAKNEVWEDELPIVAPLFPDGPPADAFRAGSQVVPKAPAESTPAAAAAGRPRLSFGHGSFQLRTRPASSEEE